MTSCAYLRRCKKRPKIGATLARALQVKRLSNVGKPEIVGPTVGIHLNVVTEFMVGAIDQNPGHAGFPHFSEGDLLSSHPASLVAGRVLSHGLNLGNDAEIQPSV
jgi:hypothetical protein